jgi:excinuclease UvrABC nuclease subunit
MLPPESLRFDTVDQVRALPCVPYSKKSLLPQAPGLYFVITDDDQVVYVGEAWESIKARWLDHAKTRALRRTTSVRIAYVLCTDSGVRHWAERYAIEHLDPPMNVHYRRKPDPAP